tara:strand:+ start:17558 stop:18517 length:960 start_codon:yes stop_codon:yes gene_type:complete
MSSTVLVATLSAAIALLGLATIALAVALSFSRSGEVAAKGQARSATATPSSLTDGQFVGCWSVDGVFGDDPDFTLNGKRAKRYTFDPTNLDDDGVVTYSNILKWVQNERKAFRSPTYKARVLSVEGDSVTVQVEGPPTRSLVVPSEQIEFAEDALNIGTLVNIRRDADEFEDHWLAEWGSVTATSPALATPWGVEDCVGPFTFFAMAILPQPAGAQGEGPPPFFGVAYGFNELGFKHKLDNLACAFPCQGPPSWTLIRYPDDSDSDAFALRPTDVDVRYFCGLVNGRCSDVDSCELDGVGASQFSPVGTTFAVYRRPQN